MIRNLKETAGISTLCGLLIITCLASNTDGCDCKNFEGEAKKECLEREKRYRQESEEAIEKARKLILGEKKPDKDPAPEAK